MFERLSTEKLSLLNQGSQGRKENDKEDPWAEDFLSNVINFHYISFLFSLTFGTADKRCEKEEDSMDIRDEIEELWPSV